MIFPGSWFQNITPGRLIFAVCTFFGLSFSCLQVLGSIYGVRLLIETFPEVELGPRLNVNIHHGALTEGVLTFAIVIISLGLARNIPGSFYMKTWIASVSKLALHILGSDLTGGCMNPAAVSTNNCWYMMTTFCFSH